MVTIPDINFGVIAPELILSLTACAVLIIDVFVKKRGWGAAYLSLAAVLAAMLWASYNFEPVTTFSGMYEADRFTQFFKLIFLLGTGLTILISVRYAQDENIDHGEYYALLLFATVGMMFMAAGSDMITIFMGLELLSISLYILAGYTRSRMVSNEASLKYFLLGAFASGFLLYGMAFIYGITGHTQLELIAATIAESPSNVLLLTIAAALILVGLGFKIAAVPFHQWTPDVYQGSPIPVTAFMSAGPKAAGLAAILRIFYEGVSYLHVDWTIWLSALAVMTMTLGNVAALVQKDAKRMLAFSSIAHAGYALVGVAAANRDGASSVMYYMLIYTFMNIGVFGILALVARKNESRTQVNDFSGLAYKNPLLAVVMTILVFSLAGIPPMAGFMAKFYVFMAAMKAELYLLVLAAVINSAIGVYYYLRFVIVMYMREPDAAAESLPVLKASPALVIALLIALYGIIRLGISPGGYLAFAEAAFISF
ncbi:MAG: NADH-quinone oxidoreductase subunit N [bacterium]|nr:MAG: NADH-quinone oxidoreductase subunit N [bacterium]